jgi:hypothetical protein
MKKSVGGGCPAFTVRIAFRPNPGQHTEGADGNQNQICFIHNLQNDDRTDLDFAKPRKLTIKEFGQINRRFAGRPNLHF